jgi:hypothetical protein
VHHRRGQFILSMNQFKENLNWFQINHILIIDLISDFFSFIDVGENFQLLPFKINYPPNNILLQNSYLDHH